MCDEIGRVTRNPDKLMGIGCKGWVQVRSVGPNPTSMLIDAQAGQVFATVRTLDAQTGALLRTVAVGGMEPHDMHRIAVVTLGSRVYVSAAGLKILETSTDALFQNVAARGGTVAVDEQLGRVHVANYGANRVDVLNADRHKYCAPFRSAQRHPTLLSTWWRDECSS